MKINWKRLVWVVFIVLYAGLFFYNCLRPFDNWLVPYIYTMILVVWLSYEYYKKNLFFQSGLIPDSLYFWLSRALLALFFYSSFVLGIATVVWWPKNSIGFYPVINILGICTLIVSIYLRQRTFQCKCADEKKLTGFYISVIVLLASLALGYGSLFLLFYLVVAGLVLVWWNYLHERRVMAKFAEYLKKHGGEAARENERVKYWDKYLASIEEKPKKK